MKKSNVKKLSRIFIVCVILTMFSPVLSASEYKPSELVKLVYILDVSHSTEYESLDEVISQNSLDREKILEELKEQGLDEKILNSSDNIESFALSIPVVLLIQRLVKVWSLCSTVARGMGMAGCWTVIQQGYSTIKDVYDRIY